jgi:AmmeMemoRadiSam system protein A
MSRRSEESLENLASSQATHSSPSPEFSLEQRQILLGIAHKAILCSLERRPIADSAPTDLRLSESRGVFTTLYLEGQLRGCVGYAVPVAPLYLAVAETACAAAFEDTRFVPVMKEEALRLEISLSVLSRLFPIHAEAVEVGRHGLVISQGARRGLLLPQVPIEHGWEKESFLDQTCRKAGLPLDAWRKGATIEAFTAEVFSDIEAQVSS